jgi:hypothetical protein
VDGYALPGQRRHACTLSHSTAHPLGSALVPTTLQAKDVKLQSHLIAALESLAAQKQLLAESQMEVLGRLLAEAREQRAADSKRLAPGGGSSASGSPVAPRRSLLGFGRKGSRAASSNGGSPRVGAAPQQRVFDLGDDE